MYLQFCWHKEYSADHTKWFVIKRDLYFALLYLIALTSFLVYVVLSSLTSLFFSLWKGDFEMAAFILRWQSSSVEVMCVLRGKRYIRAVIALVVCVVAFYDNPTFSCDFEKSSYLMLCHQDICIKNVLGTKVRNKHIMQLLMTWERDSWDRVLRWHSCVLTLPELSDFLKWCSQLNSALLFNMGGGDDVLEHLTTSS